MANLDRNDNLNTTGLATDPTLTTTGTVGSADTTSGGTTRVYDAPARTSSSYMPFLVGGLVIVAGLLAFLFYDGGSRDVSTTGSTTPRVESPAAPGGGAAGTNRGTMGTTGSTTGGAATGTTPAR